MWSQPVDVKVLGRRVNADVEPGYATPFSVEPQGSLGKRKNARQRVWGLGTHGSRRPLGPSSVVLAVHHRLPACGEKVCSNMYGQGELKLMRPSRQHRAA